MSYETAPAGIVSIDSTGLALPLTDGHVTVTAVAPSGQRTTVELIDENQIVDTPVNFPNQIVPIFTKLGCNTGGCHGKASGQNGFKLSLLGFEPGEDYEYLVKEGRGRRLFPAAPDAKPAAAQSRSTPCPTAAASGWTPTRTSTGCSSAGSSRACPTASPTDPTVARIEVMPAERSMQRGSEQQITVLAHYSDGSIEDVTRHGAVTSRTTAKWPRSRRPGW